MRGDAEPPATADRSDVERSVSAPPMQGTPERTLSYDEFNPRGTLTLILLYLGILTLLWVFMYFVEFLGNELVVVG